MRSVSVNAVLLGLGLAGLVGLAMLRIGDSGVNASYYSTYDSGRNGYRALYDVLRHEGLPVTRFERVIGLLDPRTKTLVLSSNSLESGAIAAVSDMSVADAARLRTFVERGGRLVLLGGRAYPSLRKALNIPLLSSTASKSLAVPGAQVFAPVVHVAMNAGVASVYAPASMLFSFAVAPDALPVLANRRGIFAFEVQRGKGRVIEVAAPNVWSNAYLARRDNARFAYSVLAGSGPIAFDERVHGYALDKSFWAALPTNVHIAVYIVIALVLLWLIEANFFALPDRQREVVDERDSGAYLDAMASLLRRARAGAAVIARFADERSDLAALQQLRGLSRPNDAEVLHAAQLFLSLRKEHS